MMGKLVRISLLMMALGIVANAVQSQSTVPLGLHYQAVARNSAGNELQNAKIDVRFSIIAGDPLSSPVFSEVHQNVLTSQFGVFSLVIGSGTPCGDAPGKSLAEISWGQANHYLKVEVKFPGYNDFIDMTTMQFMAVPYALYAQQSLEPGPTGPKGDPGEKGDPGDPASDDQTLSVVNVDGADYLAISGGNQVKVSSIEKDGDPANEIQDLAYNSSTRELQLTKSGLAPVNLTELKNDADADPQNEIQDLTLSGDVLSISKLSGARQVNLGVYRDNTDNQQLTYSEADNSLTIARGNTVTLGTMTAFRAKKTVATSAPTPLSNVDFVPDNIEYNDGSGLNTNTGEFTANVSGIFTFDVKYVAPSTGSGRILMIFKNGNLYETLGSDIAAGTTLFRSLTIKLETADKIKVVINTGTAQDIGTGTFSGYKVY
ncbi:MAG TPA: collagen-like protein [Bacteroidales bacterium]|nr:collagen-like protein [Bacteroidales bacterium]HPJ59123.1 collagen-like protein [Bacteroidales bacterium]HRW85262.1 collagen-like protein [Bacteroidales bacterium]